MAALFGSEGYWHSGVGNWLVFYRRLDDRFAVSGSESGGLYASFEEYDEDLNGERPENHNFV